MLRGDAHAGIGHRQADKFARACLWVGAGIGGVKTSRVRGDVQVTAARHGVAGVDGEVEEHLLDHAGVRPDEGQRLGIAAFQVNVLADDPLEHLG